MTAETRLYDFDMKAVAEDPQGYYYVRWDLATPVTVRAEDRHQAFTECFRVMGEAPRGRRWTATVDRIRPAGQALTDEGEAS